MMLQLKHPATKCHFLSKKYGHNIFLKRKIYNQYFPLNYVELTIKLQTLIQKSSKKELLLHQREIMPKRVALSAQTLNLDATIVMPKTTPSIKVAAVKRLGAKVVLFGDNYDQACEHAETFCKSEKKTFIHPYDDEYVILGSKETIGLEIIDQLKAKPDKVFIAVGGGR